METESSKDMSSSRERITDALNHKEPDRIPIDLGGSATSGMHVSIVYKLRQALGLDSPGTPVKVTETFQMLGEIELDLVEALGIDVLPLKTLDSFFGFKLEGWKEWTMFDGTPVLVPEGFNTIPETSGEILMYPGGDKTAPASGHMPKGGYFFDAIIRQQPIDDDNLNVEDNLEEFGPISDQNLEYLKLEAERLYTTADKALLGSFGGTGFGDIALVPAVQLKHPKGIRDIEEWYGSTSLRRDYIYEIFQRQCEIALENLVRLHAAVGDRISVIFVCGTDFGTQNGPFISPNAYRDLYHPVYKQVNDWIHKNTSWKTFKHSCGSISALIPDLIESGFDILNPVQCSATNMDPAYLKETFGDRVTFWGGGVDTQRTLPFGTPDEVRAEVRERLKIFGKGGGFVFNPIHNVQARTPIENLLAMYETVRDFGKAG